MTVRESVAALPAASTAATIITLLPLNNGIPEALQLVVPLAMPLPPRSPTHLTSATPTLSRAVPPG